MAQHQKSPQGLSIFHRLFLSILATSFLIISIIGTVYYFSAHQRITGYVNEQIARSLDEAVLHFTNSYQSAISSDLILLEAVPALNNFLTAPKHEKNLVRFDIEKMFAKLCQARDNLYRSIIFFDAYGVEKVAVVEKKRLRKLSSLSQYPADSLRAQKTRRLFNRLKAAKPGAILVEDLFDSPDGPPLFMVGISKREPEIAGFGGIIVATCDLSPFITYLKNITIFNKNGAWLFSAHGKTLLSPAGQDTFSGQGLPPSPQTPLASAGLSGQGDNAIIRYARCTLGTDNQKLLDIAFDVSPEIFSDLLKESLVKASFLITVITAVVFSIALIQARKFSRPISKLVWASTLLSKGDFQTKVAIKTGGEIGLLAQSFNDMAEALHRSIVARDQEIAFRKRSEQALKEKKEEIRLLLDSTAEAIYGLDMNGNCTFCNPACLRILGYQHEEDLIGKHMHTMIHHTRSDNSAYPTEECQIYQTLRKKEGVHIDNEVLWRADGTSFWAEYWSYPVFKGGDLVGAVVTFIDISERKTAEEEKKKLNIQLRQAQKMEAIGTLAGGIAHDFNNILQALIGYTEMAKENMPAESHVVGDLDQVLHAANRAKELVKQILTFSRQSEHKREALQLHLVAKEALKLIRASIPTTIEIRENIDLDCGTVLANPTQIHQIVMNLCTNAYHAMRETGGILTVELSHIEIKENDTKVSALHWQPGPYVMLIISDTGCGMNRATRDRIFEPYFTTKDQGEGSGMGLAVTHGIVKKYGGHITVDSEPGHGSTFQVYLPCLEPPTSSAASNNGEDLPKGQEQIMTAAKAPSGKERILVVDDEETVVQLEKKILERLGYQVTAMVSCEEALQAFSSQPDHFDLVITDMTMPHMTGATLAQQLLTIRPDIAIIMCSGFNEQMTEEKAKAIGIREFILKPIQIKDMARVVRTTLDGRS